MAGGNLGGRLGDTERNGQRGRSSAFGGWSNFQTPPSSWRSEGVPPPRTGEVIVECEATMPSAETELAEKEMKETGVREKGDVRESRKETDGTKGIRDTMRVTEQPKMKVCRDTAMGSMENEVDIRESIQAGDVPKKKRKEDSKRCLGRPCTRRPSWRRRRSPTKMSDFRLRSRGSVRRQAQRQLPFENPLGISLVPRTTTSSQYLNVRPVLIFQELVNLVGFPVTGGPLKDELLDTLGRKIRIFAINQTNVRSTSLSEGQRKILSNGLFLAVNPVTFFIETRLFGDPNNLFGDVMFARQNRKKDSKLSTTRHHFCGNFNGKTQVSDKDNPVPVSYRLPVAAGQNTNSLAGAGGKITDDSSRRILIFELCTSLAVPGESTTGPEDEPS